MSSKGDEERDDFVRITCCCCSISTQVWHNPGISHRVLVSIESELDEVRVDPSHENLAIAEVYADRVVEGLPLRRCEWILVVGECIGHGRV